MRSVCPEKYDYRYSIKILPEYPLSNLTKYTPGWGASNVVSPANGTWIVSDEQGKYSHCGLRPRTHVLKVDARTLPRKSRLVTSISYSVSLYGNIACLAVYKRYCCKQAY